jgi:ribose transport system permease protein
MSATKELSPGAPTRVPRPGDALNAVREYGIVFCVVALLVILALSSDVFLTKRNFLNILDQSSAVGLMAAAGTLVIIAGGFDLSVGAIFALAGVAASKLAPSVGSDLALILGMLTGLLVGCANGVLTTYGRINPLVATLSTGIMIRGLALVITSGFVINVADPAYGDLGNGKIFGIDNSILIWAVFAILCGLILARTTLGRAIFASGGNAEAARLSGIRVNVVRTATYALSGLAAGIAGVVVSSRVSSGQADAGTGAELSVIAAIVIGGTSILGGEGAVWRSILGVLLLALIANGFNLLDINPIYQQIVQGGIILLAVAIDAWAKAARD